jgi:anti-anti-sigma regulatory factor
MSVAAVQHPHGYRSQRLFLSSRRSGGNGTDVEISVIGQVDAANAKEFAVAVCELTVEADLVTLNLSDLDFMAFDGVAALHAINAHMTRIGAPWCVVPGTAASRVLELCDPEQLIPRPVPQTKARGNRPFLRLVQSP